MKYLKSKFYYEKKIKIVNLTHCYPIKMDKFHFFKYITLMIII